MPSRFRWLPGRGRLLVSTDLHGNGADLRALSAVYKALCAERPEPEAETEPDTETHWALLGDLVHGPDDAAREDQPELYGYPDESPSLPAQVLELMAEHPDRIHYVLGNHDHGHVGGPHTGKFYDDEVLALEARLGEAERAALRALFSSAYLALAAPCGVLLCHGSPDHTLRRPTDLDDIPLEAGRATPYQRRVLDTFLRSYGQRAEVTARLLARFGSEPKLSLVVHGHDRDESGYFTDGDNQVCPVIFGALRENKRYLVLDLGARYASAGDLREGIEIRRLYPEAEPDR
jgi:hypothetical protein